MNNSAELLEYIYQNVKMGEKAIEELTGMYQRLFIFIMMTFHVPT